MVTGTDFPANIEKMVPVTIISALILGATSMIGQILLMRELTTVFYGNETSYAVTLASWLGWIAAGSFMLSRLAERISFPRRVLALLLTASAVILPATLAAGRVFPGLLGIRTGEVIGIVPMGLMSFLLIGPLAFLLGATFTVICRLPVPGEAPAPAADINRVYLCEAVGAVLGGGLYCFFLIHVLTTLQVAVIVGAVNLLGALCARGRGGAVSVGIGLLGIGFVLALPTGAVTAVDDLTRQRQWSGLTVVTSADSLYGHITLTRLGDEFSLYQNGILSYSTRDDSGPQENTHYALLAHPAPKRVLLVGNGLGGALAEILKHPIEQLDYVELDPQLVRVSRKHLPASALTPLADDRLRTLWTDGRMHIKQTGSRYDVIIVNLGDPYTALINRYYTVDFFREAEHRLTQQGVLALSVSSSENYLNDETRDFLQSIHTSLRTVFTEAVAIPGENTVFLACRSAGVLSRRPQTLISRLRERGIVSQYVSEHTIPFKLEERRLLMIDAALQPEGVRNTDLRPVAYFYDIVLWSTHFSLFYKRLMEALTWLRWEHLLVFPGLLVLIGYVRRPGGPRFAVATSIMTTGLSEVIFQLIVIIAFQTLYGYAYYQLGLIVTFFMLGLVVGSAVARAYMGREVRQVRRIYLTAQAGIVLYPLLLPAVFHYFREVSTTANMAFFAATFTALPIVAGFIGGLQYPLAAKLNLSGRNDPQGDKAGVAGGLYAADSWGAMLGSLLTGAVLIPLLGIAAVAYLCAALNLAVLILLRKHL